MLSQPGNMRKKQKLPAGEAMSLYLGESYKKRGHPTLRQTAPFTDNYEKF